MNKKTKTPRNAEQRSDAVQIATHLAVAVVLGLTSRYCLTRAVEKAFLG